jgi:hypothetical protein
MRQFHNITLILTLITTWILSGITLLEPIMVYGQSKRKIVLSPEGLRDPFIFPSGVHLLSKKDTPTVTRSGLSTMEIKPSPLPLKVNAILISDHIRLASIDRYIVTVGDSIHDEKVLEIRNDRVILGKGDNKRTLLLSQSPVQLTVEER